MTRYKDFTIRSQDELSQATGLREQVETLLIQFDYDMFPLCDMHAGTIRSLYRKLQDLNEDLAFGIDRFTHR